jgi:hypothetical protein
MRRGIIVRAPSTRPGERPLAEIIDHRLSIIDQRSA